MNNTELYQLLEKKYECLGTSSATYLKGHLHAKELDYWSYVQLDTLLSLQNPKTHFKDEEVFIIYHQITELVLKLMLNELKQMVENGAASENLLLSKFKRLHQYTELLINSFAIMRVGMNYDDYNVFRNTLAPASGFQSVQFRYVELHCTALENLVTNKNKIVENSTVEDLMEIQYWKAAGVHPITGKKTLTLIQFEEKYAEALLSKARKLRGTTINDCFERIKNPSAELIKMMRVFDYLYNIKWPIVHLETASHYLDSKGEEKEATGGSDWKKYLHPKYQRRMFFPNVWTHEELENWADPCFFHNANFQE